MAGPPREAILAAKAAAEAGLVPVGNFTIVDPTSPNGLRTRVAGQVVFGRRIPTKEEISEINRSLAAFEAAGKPGALPVIAVPPSAAPNPTAATSKPMDKPSDAIPAP